MEKDIKNIRIEDLIQSEFDKEVNRNGIFTPNRESDEEKAKIEEAKEIFLWLMPMIRQHRLWEAKIWFLFSGNGLDLRRDTCVLSHYTPQNPDVPILTALNFLINKMEATKRMEVLEKTGSYVVLGFDFFSRI